MITSDDKEKLGGHPSPTVTIRIDRKEYMLKLPPDGKIFMTGNELRKLADPPIDEKRELFEVVPGGSDRKVEDDKEIQIRDGMRFFSAPAQINPGCRQSYLTRSLHSSRVNSHGGGDASK